MQNDIFFSETDLIKKFEQSLSPEEKKFCKEYIAYLNWPTTTIQERQNRNLAVMCYIDGVRYGERQNSNFEHTMYQTAVKELVRWTEMTEETIRKILVQKTHEYLNKEKKT